MDRVKLGRVLGRGARQAARTVWDAVDAARSPNPAAARASAGPVRRIVPGQAPAADRAEAPANRTAQAAAPSSVVQNAVRGAARASASARTARQGVLAPVKRASRAVSLEIAGSFFGLFAMSFAAAAWRFRDAGRGAEAQRLWLCGGCAALFAYFAVSSFLRARRIARG